MTRPTRTVWILTVGACALVGVGLGSLWGLGQTASNTDGGPPDLSSVSPLTEDEAAGTVFVGSELDALLVDDAELQSVIDLGVPIEPIDHTFDLETSYGASPEECGAFDGIIDPQPAGYRSITANTSPSHSTTGTWFREQVFQYGTVQSAADWMDGITADVDTCGQFTGGQNPEGAEEAPTQAALTRSDGGSLPVLIGTTTVQATQGYAQEWVMIRIGNVIALAQYGHLDSVAGLTDAEVAGVQQLIVDRALRAAAVVGDDDV